jgi:copper transport protein
MSVRHQCRAAAAAVAFTLVALVGWAAPASAHTNLLGTEPPDGAAVEQSPTDVTLVFSENVEIQLTRVQITNGSGASVAIGPLARDPQHPTHLLVPLPAGLPADTYRVVFTTRDSTDLHETSGAIVFGVATVPPAAVTAVTSTGTRPAEVALRWISRAGLALILGALAFIVFVLGGSGRTLGPDDGVSLTIQRRRQLRLVIIGAALVALAESGILFLQAADIGSLGSSLSRVLLHSEFGSRWILTVIVLLGLGLFLPVLGRRYTVTKGRLAFGVAIVLSGIGAISGHSGGNSGVLSVRIAMRALHLVSVGTWAGGLVALLVALSAARPVGPEALSGDAARRLRTALLARFGELALVAFVGAVVSGLVLSGEQVSTVTALLSTLYGTALLIKIGVLGLVAIVGFRHAWRVRRWQRAPVRDASAPAASAARAPLTRRSLTLEVVGALLVIGLGATLGATSPARGPRFDPPPKDVFPSTLSVQQGDLLVRVSIKPNRPGRNLLSADMTSTRRPPGHAVTAVTFRLRAPGGDPAGDEFRGVSTGPATLSSPAAGIGNSPGFAAAPVNHFEVPVQLTPGDLGVTALLDRGSAQPERVDLHWTVNPRGVKRAKTVLSDTRLAPWTLALGLVALVFGAVCGVFDRRRRRRAHEHRGGFHPAGRHAPTRGTGPELEPGTLPVEAASEGVASGVGGDGRR